MEVKKAILHYCQYQERCHSEVKNKLYELGCNTTEVNENIANLIEAGALNEERFAKAYARGKFRMKQWGKIKIKQHLKQKQVSDYCIKKAFLEINEDEYHSTIRKLAETKKAELKGEKNIFTKRGKLYRYLAQKGYEQVLILEMIEALI